MKGEYAAVANYIFEQIVKSIEVEDDYVYINLQYDNGEEESVTITSGVLRKIMDAINK